MDYQRDLFEEKVFAAYFIKGIQKDPQKPESQMMVSEHNLTKAELLKRTDGSTPQEYVREEIDAMWFGWKLAIERELRKRTRFPMLNGPSIDWTTAEEIYKIYKSLFGGNQTLEHMAQRGGFSWGEVERMLIRSKHLK